MIEARLCEMFQPDMLEVLDESHLHAGHREAAEGGQSHFRVRIVAGAFADKSRLERHRMVYKALEDALNQGVHALAIDATAPGEH